VPPVDDAHELPGGRQAASTARRVLVKAIGEHVDSRTLADAQVVATELIGLVMTDPRDERELQLRVSLDARRLRVTVTPPDGQERPEPAPHNLALVLVDHLADRWSFERSDGLGLRRV
jgi:hypothetical protein